LLGAIHNVEGSGLTHDAFSWVVTVVLLALILVWEVVNKIVALFKSSTVKDSAHFLGNWVSLFILNTWLKRILSWGLDALSISLPFLNETNNTFFNITFWGSKVIVVLTIIVTAKTGEVALDPWISTKIDHIVLIPHNSSTTTGDREKLAVESLNEEDSDVNRKSSNYFSLNMDGTTGEELYNAVWGVKYKGSSTFVSRAIVVDHNERHGMVDSFKNDVRAFASEGEFFSVKGSNVALGDGADTIAFVFSTVELSAEADALVTVSSKPFSWLEDFFAVKTWALFNSNTLSLMSILVEWTVAAVNAVFVAAASRVWVVAAWGTRRTAWVIFLAFWALDWASALASPFYVDTVSAALSEVSSH
jgi:hypothetical protein